MRCNARATGSRIKQAIERYSAISFLKMIVCDSQGQWKCSGPIIPSAVGFRIAIAIRKGRPFNWGGGLELRRLVRACLEATGILPGFYWAACGALGGACPEVHLGGPRPLLGLAGDGTMGMRNWP